ncbi:hypothetical protein [Paenibacillus xylaniclasticus]|uniref:hypothetical protein n=1 Tax=Paenibacillus xylaniclasticus TaxID=588083 RepID=UPI000FD900BB|nr:MULTISPECIES: hypothetical protein [Paenibacillus]GFN33100.1 hypothetical protein PCURB6_33600 [Paenibacillus curdlanolyticus]
MPTHTNELSELQRVLADNERLTSENESLMQELAKCKEELAAARRELARLRGRSGSGRSPEAMSTMASRLRDALRE